ncbi:DnaJ family domain-containing protein [Paenibacillus guangzhouensis]|uniref:DnaJ family domain-containing protein n=1 Tax=Paenibacillus guangzhouensis TaxID=1473112 RepID=UPI00187B2D2A|nr:DUF1992 domain-containing protein [Paenibacillus guangzhouensis]
MFWKKRKSRQEASENISIPRTEVQEPIVPKEAAGIEIDVGKKEPREEIETMSVAEQAIRDFERKGGFQDLPGMHKPIEVTQGDPLHAVLKNAHVLPAWLELQHEIRDEIGRLLARQAVQEPEQIDALNQKIDKYNRLVPSSLFQKRRVSAAMLQEHYEQWS